MPRSPLLLAGTGWYWKKGSTKSWWSPLVGSLLDRCPWKPWEPSLNLISYGMGCYPHMDKPMPKPTSTTFWGAGAALLAPCFLSPGAGQLRGTPTETQAAAGQRQVERALLRYCIVESGLMLKGWCTLRLKKTKPKVFLVKGSYTTSTWESGTTCCN